MDDKLHQPYRMGWCWYAASFLRSEKQGPGVALSGSGPTVIDLCDRSCPQIGLAMQRAFEKHGILCKVMELTDSQTGAVNWSD